MTTEKHDMASFQTQLKAAKHITVIAGAGLSAASGIPTFRGAGGLWRKYDAMSLATPEAFAENPARSWAFYEYRRRKFADASRRRLSGAPECTAFSFITQIAEPYCTRCKTVYPKYGDVPIVPSLSNIVRDVESNGPEVPIPEAELPHCEKSSCKGLLRPGVVWFGEVPRHLDEIDEILQRTELLLVVGTSSTVYPAAGFAARVRRNRHRGKVAVFNLEPSEGDSEADYVFYGPCEESLPAVLGV